jgi:hypothetical protein
VFCVTSPSARASKLRGCTSSSLRSAMTVPSMLGSAQTGPFQRGTRRRSQLATASGVKREAGFNLLDRPHTRARRLARGSEPTRTNRRRERLLAGIRWRRGAGGLRLRRPQRRRRVDERGRFQIDPPRLARGRPCSSGVGNPHRRGDLPPKSLAVTTSAPICRTGGSFCARSHGSGQTALLGARAATSVKPLVVARDRIEFRRIPTKNEAYGPDTVDVVEIHINGRPLTDLWSRAAGEGGRWVRAADTLWPGRRLWSDDPFSSSDLADGQRRVVLVCDDGLTGCGGATANVRLDDRYRRMERFPHRAQR